MLQITTNVEGLSKLIGKSPGTINRLRREGILPYILFGDDTKNRKIIIYPITEVQLALSGRHINE